MFEIQIEQARDIIDKVDFCKERKNAVPDSKKVSSAELEAWIEASEQLVIYTFGENSDELIRYRDLHDSIPQLQDTAIKRDGPEWTWTYWINFFRLMIGLLQEFEAKWNAHGKSSEPDHVPLQSRVDIVILTVLPEEFQAVFTKIANLKPAPHRKDHPNLYAWRTGTIESNNGAYSLALGMVGYAGNTNSALATIDAVNRWRPRYIIFVGIAGGIKDVSKGDVIIADAIYGYEYGKIEKSFAPRDRKYDTDLGLRNGATVHGLSSVWKDLIGETPPTSTDPKVVTGEIASGEKVVDDPTNEFFGQVIKKWPKIKAVEMEGAGAASAIDQARAMGMAAGFLMIRGISDLPRATAASHTAEDVVQGTIERDAWKNYAAETAAAFTISFIATALPVQA